MGRQDEIRKVQNGTVTIKWLFVLCIILLLTSLFSPMSVQAGSLQLPYFDVLYYEAQDTAQYPGGHVVFEFFCYEDNSLTIGYLDIAYDYPNETWVVDEVADVFPCVGNDVINIQDRIDNFAYEILVLFNIDFDWVNVFPDGIPFSFTPENMQELRAFHDSMESSIGSGGDAPDTPIDCPIVSDGCEVVTPDVGSTHITLYMPIIIAGG